MPTIEGVQRAISRKFYNREETLFKLTLKGSLLPAWESSLILRDDDHIMVEHEATHRNSSEFWSKKKKRKKKPMSGSKKFYFPASEKTNSQSFTESKNVASSGDADSVFTSKTLQESTSTPIADAEQQENGEKKRKKKKTEDLSESNYELEEIAAPSKKVKVSKSPKHKKMTSSQELTPESNELTSSPKKVLISQLDDQNEQTDDICNESKSPCKLKKVEPEVIKVVNEVSENVENFVPMDVSDSPPTREDSSKAIENDSLEKKESKTLVCSTENNEALLLSKDSESKPELTAPNLGNTYNAPRDSPSPSPSSSSQEKVEVYKIRSEDLEEICQSLTEGETLSIDQDKVKLIDIENTSNSSWFDCVEVDSVFPNEPKKIELPAGKDGRKGSGINVRRRRRKRGQRSFACSPFIHAMNQSLDSDNGNKSPSSTPVSSQSKSKPPVFNSSNNPKKHFYFESDNDEDDYEEDEEVAKKDICQSKMAGSEDAKTKKCFGRSESNLSSKKNNLNGDEDSNSSAASRGDEREKDKIFSSSQKNPSKKSVHFDLGKSLSESFESTSQKPIIYKRGQSISSQRRNLPTLIRQQQLNTSLESCSSICTSVEEDPDSSSVNGRSSSKPRKEYSLLPSIVGSPRAGDKIAFKRLEIGEDYTPQLSGFIEAKVLSFQEDKKMITMKIPSIHNNRRKEGKFELVYQNDQDIMILDQEDETVSVELNTLQEVKLLK